MSGFCLVPSVAEVFLKKLRNGEIDPEKLSNMSSKQRREFFQEFMELKEAKSTNALFESKLLLKNQQAGIINWAKQLTNIKPKIRQDILAKAQSMTKILQPKEMKNFMADLAEKKLGIGVTAEEAKTITELAQKIADLKGLMNPKTFKFVNDGTRLALGRARVAFGNYVADLQLTAAQKTIRDRMRIREIGNNILDAGGIAKSLKASLDVSAIGRQGYKTMYTHPTIWAKNSALAFVDFIRTVQNENVVDEVMADILSRPNALNGLYTKEQLAIGNVEEAFPSHFPEKIPLLGRLFKGSDAAFTAFSLRQRADIFDKYIEKASKMGAEIEGIGKLVNSLTGRGHLGGLEPVADILNKTLFAPRFFKSHLDVLTGHVFSKNMGSFAKKQAGLNWMKLVFGTASMLLIARALLGEKSVELDPRSSDSGKIKVGDTRIDATGGMSSILTLSSRILPMFSYGHIKPLSKNSTTGKFTEINGDGFGSMRGDQVLLDFAEGKLSPIASILKDTIKGEDFSGEDLTILGELSNLLLPLPVSNYLELKDNPNAAPLALAMVADALGFGTNTYSPKDSIPTLDRTVPEQNDILQEFGRLSTLSQKPTIANFEKPTGNLALLRDQIGPEKFKEAKAAYLADYSKSVSAYIQTKEYKALTSDAKKSSLNHRNDGTLSRIYYKFGFVHPTKQHSTDL